MAIYHNSIKTIGRKDNRSIVAAAAYRAGILLYDEENSKKYNYTKKGESQVMFSEIMLPDNAPEKYRDNRELLWNDVQKIETRSDARFAREVQVALPVEFDRQTQIEVLEKYIDRNFVSKGMIADFSIHDKDGTNPHAHILLTTRGFNKNQEWDMKVKSVFANDIDVNGKAIYNPNKPVYDPKNKEATKQYRIPIIDFVTGEQKYRERPGKGKEMMWERVNINNNDWNSKDTFMKWVEDWATVCNEYLPENKKIDHRSYAEQGIEKIPTVHEGWAPDKKKEKAIINEEIRIVNETREKNIRLIEEKQKEIEELKKLEEQLAVSDDITVENTTEENIPKTTNLPKDEPDSDTVTIVENISATNVNKPETVYSKDYERVLNRENLRKRYEEHFKNEEFERKNIERKFDEIYDRARNNNNDRPEVSTALRTDKQSETRETRTNKQPGAENTILGRAIEIVKITIRKIVGTIFGSIEELRRRHEIVERIKDNINRTEQYLDRTQQYIGRTEQYIDRTEQCIGRTEQYIGRTQQCVDKTEQYINEHVRPVTSSLQSLVADALTALDEEKETRKKAPAQTQKKRKNNDLDR